MFTPLQKGSGDVTIRVAIVDDNVEMSQSVVELLSAASGIRVVATYTSGEAALREFPGRPADVVLMDLRLPGMTGVQCAQALKRMQPTLAIMMFTAFGEDDAALFQSLQLGASGYILKRSSAFVLVDAIRELHAGGSPMSPSIARKVVKFFQGKPPSSPASVAGDGGQPLTAREREVLEMLAEGLRYKEIADQLHLSVTTVRTHLGRIYDKLHVTSRTEAVVKFLKANP